MGKRRNRKKSERMSDEDDEDGASSSTATKTTTASHTAGVDDKSVCHKCRQPGHISSKCPVAKMKKKEKQKCYLCGKHGHTRRQCPGIDDHGSGQSKYKGKRSKRPTKNAEEDFHGDGDSAEEHLSSSLPFIDALVYLPYLYTTSNHHGDLKSFFDHPKQQRDRHNLAKLCRGCVTAFAHPEVLFPEDGSPMYRIWEQERMFGDDLVWMTFGLLPKYNNVINDANFERIAAYATDMDSTKLVAIGPTGISIHKGVDDVGEEIATQTAVAMRFLSLAQLLNKPLILQMKNVSPRLIQKFFNENIPVDLKMLLIDCPGDCLYPLSQKYRNLYFACNGIVTHDKQKAARNALFDIPLEKLVLFTEAPVLNKMPSILGGGRSKYFHSGHLPIIADTVATIKKTTVDNVLEAVYANTVRLYDLPIDGKVGKEEEQGDSEEGNPCDEEDVKENVPDEGLKDVLTNDTSDGALTTE